MTSSGSGRPPGHAERRQTPSERCKNLYEFIRLRLGDSVSDREIARRWGVQWKSYVSLKQGQRQVPRMEQLESLASVLGVEPGLVFEVARGVPAHRVAALLDREDRYRVRIERVRDAIFTVDTQGRIRDLNQHLCDLVGREGAELLGRPVSDLVDPASRSSLVSALAGAARGELVRGTEIEIEAAGGGHRTVRLDVVRIADAEEAIGCQVVARDVTEERRLAAALDEERSLIQIIHECVPAACMLFDRDGTILSANPHVERLYPVRASEMVGRTSAEVFGDPDPAGCPVTRAFLTGQVERQVSLVEGRDGEIRYVHRTAGPIVQDGRVDKVIEMMVDVTSQVERGDLRVLALWRRPEMRGHEPERRAAPRARTGFPASVSCKGREAVATVVSLGVGGMFLEGAEVDADVGDELDVEWQLPDDEAAVRVSGVIVWKQRSPRGVGVRFETVRPEFAPVARGGRARVARRRRPSSVD